MAKKSKVPTDVFVTQQHNIQMLKETGVKFLSPIGVQLMEVKPCDCARCRLSLALHQGDEITPQMLVDAEMITSIGHPDAKIAVDQVNNMTLEMRTKIPLPAYVFKFEYTKDGVTHEIELKFKSELTFKDAWFYILLAVSEVLNTGYVYEDFEELINRFGRYYQARQANMVIFEGKDHLLPKLYDFYDETDCSLLEELERMQNEQIQGLMGMIGGAVNAFMSSSWGGDDTVH